MKTDNSLYRAYDDLIKANIFVPIHFGAHQLFDFRIDFSRVAIYSLLGGLENIIKGVQFTLVKYSKSTVAIVVEKTNSETGLKDEFAGTGGLLTNGEETFILTAKHNVDPSEGCNVRAVLLGGDLSAEIKINSPPRLSPIDDLAVLPVIQSSLSSNIPRFRLSPSVSILDKVISLAYPKIPKTNNFVMTAHSGEINAAVDLRDGSHVYLISSYAAPGSSGGPVLDDAGLLVGVITERLEANYEDGVFYHTAAVSHDRIVKFLGNKL